MKKFIYLLIFFTVPLCGMLRRRMLVDNFNRNRRNTFSGPEDINRFSQNYANPLESSLLQTNLSNREREQSLNSKRERISRSGRICNGRRDS